MTIKQAYKIGFSSSLDPNTWSGYNELTKWPSIEGTRLRRSFMRGYAEGLVIMKKVKEENYLAAGKRNKTIVDA